MVPRKTKKTKRTQNGIRYKGNSTCTVLRQYVHGDKAKRTPSITDTRRLTAIRFRQNAALTALSITDVSQYKFTMRPGSDVNRPNSLKNRKSTVQAIPTSTRSRPNGADNEGIRHHHPFRTAFASTCTNRQSP